MRSKERGLAISSERLAERRQHLVATAEALIRERGDAGFSMALLAERAGVSPATPYNLLASKSDVLRRVIRADVARFVAGVERERAGASPLAALLITADRLVDHYASDRALHVGLVGAEFGARGALSEESWACWKRLTDAAIASGELTDIVRSRQLTGALLRTMGAVVQTWLAIDWSSARFALEMSLAVRLVLAGVCAPLLREGMIAEIAEIQAAIDALPSAGAERSAPAHDLSAA